MCILEGTLPARQGTLDPLEYPFQKRGGDWMNFTPIYFIVIRTLPSLHYLIGSGKCWPRLLL
jgi:hypothetical protein